MAKPKRNADETETFTSAAERRLRDDITAGRLAAGMRLAVVELSAGYGLGATPIREALSRLSAQGFVTALDGRGFRVAPLSAEDLRDLIMVRQTLEATALEAAMANGNATWEADILRALHLLERNVDEISARPPAAAGGNPAWLETLDEAHRQFHIALLAACGSPRLLQLHETYYAQTFRYRCAMFTQLPDFAHFLDEHRDLANLALARDATALPLLRRHLARTLDDCAVQLLPPQTFLEPTGSSAPT
jgi:DNA-binding GntR family transcriptional regulator